MKVAQESATDTTNGKVLKLKAQLQPQKTHSAGSEVRSNQKMTLLYSNH